MGITKSIPVLPDNDKFPIDVSIYLLLNEMIDAEADRNPDFVRRLKAHPVNHQARYIQRWAEILSLEPDSVRRKWATYMIKQWDEHQQKYFWKGNVFDPTGRINDPPRETT